MARVKRDWNSPAERFHHLEIIETYLGAIRAINLGRKPSVTGWRGHL